MLSKQQSLDSKFSSIFSEIQEYDNLESSLSNDLKFLISNIAINNLAQTNMQASIIKNNSINDKENETAVSEPTIVEIQEHSEEILEINNYIKTIDLIE